MNIVEIVLKALSGNALSQLAGAVGESPENVQKALAAIVPTLLSGIGGLATNPQGADKLWSTLRSVDDRVSDDFGKVLEGNGAGDLSKTGTAILEDLLGKVNLGSLLKTLSAFVAGHSDLVKKLVPLVAPFVLSLISKQVKSGGLDLQTLLKLLLAQKGNITKAMPAGLMTTLEGAEGLGEIAKFASSPSTVPENEVSKPATSWTTWLVAAVASVAIVAVTWNQLYQGVDAEKAKTLAYMQEAADQIKNGTYSFGSKFSPAGPTANTSNEIAGHEGVVADSTVEVKKTEVEPDSGSELSKEFSGYFERLSQSLDGIRDVESANQSLPKLEALGGQLDVIMSQVGKLPDAARASLLDVLGTGQKSLSDKVSKVIEIPGVAEIIKPILEAILSKVDLLIKK